MTPFSVGILEIARHFTNLSIKCRVKAYGQTDQKIKDIFSSILKSRIILIYSMIPVTNESSAFGLL